MDGTAPAAGPEFRPFGPETGDAKTGKETQPCSSRPWNPAAENGVRAGWAEVTGNQGRRANAAPQTRFVRAGAARPDETGESVYPGGIARFAEG